MNENSARVTTSKKRNSFEKGGQTHEKDMNEIEIDQIIKEMKRTKKILPGFV